MALRIFGPAVQQQNNTQESSYGIHQGAFESTVSEPLGKQALYHQYWKDCGKDTFKKVAVLELATFSVAVSVEKWQI
jgi:hypothetical protein